MKRIILAIASLALGTGVASADRWHGGGGREAHERHEAHEAHEGRGWGGGGRVVERDHRWEGGVHVDSGVRYNYSRPVYNNGYRYSGYGYNNYVRRPIYVQRPVIRQRYYDYRYRPQLIVENYPAQPGYYWVAGQWQWSGYEWIWQPGHYEPDASYVDPTYGYGAGYDYDNDGD